jgi:PAS domain S-box-containing protein
MASTHTMVTTTETEDRYQKVVELVSDYAYAFRVDPDGQLFRDWVTPTFAQVTGFAADDLDPRDGWARLIYPPDMPVAAARMQRLLSGQPDVSEFRIVTASGELRWLRDYAHPEIDPVQGRVARITGAAQDITERKRAEEAIRDSEERYRTLFETMAQGVIYRNANGAISKANPAALAILGASWRAINGLVGIAPEWRLIREDWSTFPPEEHPAMTALRTGQPVHDVVVGIFNQHEDAYRWTKITAIPQFRSGEDRPFQVYSIIEDITASKLAAATLIRARDFSLSLLDEFPTLVWRSDAEGQRNYVNKAWLNFTGGNAAKEAGPDWLTGVHAADLDLVRTTFAQALAARRPHVLEYRLRHRDGTDHWLLDFGRPYYNLDGQLGGYIGSCYDVTERKATEESLRSYIERLRALHALDEAVLAARSPEAVAQTALEHVSRLIPCEHASVTSFKGSRLDAGILAVHSPNSSAFAPGTSFRVADFGISMQLLQRGQTLVIDDSLGVAGPPNAVLALRLAGLRSMICVPLTVQNELIGALTLAGREPGMFGPAQRDIVREVSAPLAIAIHNARLFQQVHEARERLELLSRRLLEGQEADRRYIARELHDEIGQALTAIKISVQTAQRSLAAGTGLGAASGSLADCIGIVDQALRQVRTLSLDLRPSMLDDLGLESALRWYVDRQTQRAGLECRFDARGYGQRASPELEIACYRIAQEAITNIIRHAGAKKIQLDLRCEAGKLELTVRDDGTGFDVATARAYAAQGHSLGLISMEERASLAGGQFTIISTPDSGTAIRVVFPFRPLKE